MPGLRYLACVHLSKTLWSRDVTCRVSGATVARCGQSLKSGLATWRGPHGKENVYLVGAPGCGKTTVGRLLGPRLGRDVIDVDDDVLEPLWDMPVSQKLSQVGGERFLELEGEALAGFRCQGSVVSLTGSNPLHAAAMAAIRPQGPRVLLDVMPQEILHRLQVMKVDRVVGQERGISMADILASRQQVYEQHYDVRILVEEGESPESIADKVMGALERLAAGSGHVSTRGGGGEGVGFLQAVLQGLGRDGGLLVPEAPAPRLTLGELHRLLPLPYHARAQRILERWIHPRDFSPQHLAQCTHLAYHGDHFHSDDVIPVRHLHGNVFLTELFHGPTASFKDAALQLMPRLFSRAVLHCQAPSPRKHLILVATSGDTGGAVLDGFQRHTEAAGIGVLVLYPQRGISQLQRHQMTTMKGDNVGVVGVDGDFDFCQTTVKQIFTDPDFCSKLSSLGCHLSAANSINWGRLLPQVVYHVTAYLELVRQGHVTMGDLVDVSVPTGNFGNILSAFYAKAMGVPFRRLLCASNRNNVLTDFLQTGTYDLRHRSLQRTASPAIDILKSSNLERLLHALATGLGTEPAHMVASLYSDLDRKGVFTVPREMMERVKDEFRAGWCEEEECMREIADVYHNDGFLLDPHTAVGSAVTSRLSGSGPPTLLVATAHFAKFPDAVLHALGRSAPPGDSALQLLRRMLQADVTAPLMHPDLLAMAQKDPVHKDCLPADGDKVRDYVLQFVERL